MEPQEGGGRGEGILLVEETTNHQVDQTKTSRARSYENRRLQEQSSSPYSFDCAMVQFMVVDTTFVQYRRDAICLVEVDVRFLARA
jgi:hypothetical protein